METIFLILILILSVIIHEVSHGYAALALGDPTAKDLGRLTLNPIPHLDLWGSIIIPGLMALSGTGMIFGWAKPVPYNPYNLRNQRWGEALVAIAGPASNVLIAVVFGTLIRFGAFSTELIEIASMVVILNLVLAVFNLVPIPPLDGSKILFSILPYRFYHIRESLERYGLVLVLVFIFFLWRLITPIIFFLFNLIT
jgi:Zn-dependent protease